MNNLSQELQPRESQTHVGTFNVKNKQVHWKRNTLKEDLSSYLKASYWQNYETQVLHQI